MILAMMSDAAFTATVISAAGGVVLLAFAMYFAAVLHDIAVSGRRIAAALERIARRGQ